MPTPHALRRALAGTALVLAGSAAQAITLVGLTSSNEIARFDTSSIAAATRVAITGLAPGDRFIGLDLRPSNNTLYGITLSNQIYAVNELTGAATFVTALSAPVVSGGLGWGIDFNPVADYGGAASLRLVNSAGANYAVNVSNGVVGNAANTIAAGFTGVAYTNSSTQGAPGSTALYYVNSANGTLAVAPSAFNTPSISTVGPLGINVLSANGFEIAPDGTAYGAFNVDGGSSLVTGLYTVNLTTGAATLLGNFNGTLSGLAVSAVPEPGTYGLLALGLGGVLLAARRRRVAEA